MPRKTTKGRSSESSKPSNESAPSSTALLDLPKSEAPKPQPSNQPPVPPAKLKYRPDVGWEAKIGAYVCRAITVPGPLWYAWPKDLAVREGTGKTERDAIDALKVNLKTEIEKHVLGNPPAKIPWTDISCLRTPGSNLRWLKIEAAAPIK